jgi:radical SAM protein with 4Fe4S-binding SPASM domain
MDLVRAATERGIGASLAPAATGLLTREGLGVLKAAGIQNISLSIDGSTAEIHDGFRRVEGTFARTLECAQFAHDAGLPIQVNTLITDETLTDLPAIYALMKTLRIMRWSLFYLISVGRGSDLKEITPAESEHVNRWLFDISRTAPFQVKTTEAMHYRRHAIRTMEAEGKTADEIAATSVGRGFGIRDGNGIMFVNHDGSVYPSGFLPLVVGNVRKDNIVDLYRSSEIFTSLRDTTGFKGRCGVCEYTRICGGSRARAYAWTGDALESDPLCPYVPAARA